MTPAADAWTVADPTECPVCGRDSCDEPDHLPPEAEPAGARQAPPPRLSLRAPALLDLPAPVEIVEGVVCADQLAVLAAESGTGKTFVLLSLGAAVADGVGWHGRAVRGRLRRVCVLRGRRASPARAGAARDRRAPPGAAGHRLRASDPLSPRLTRDGEVGSLGEALIAAELDAIARDIEAAGEPPIRLCIVDTVRASLTGSEDNSEAVSAYLRAVRRLMAGAAGAAWLLAHHTGWQDGEAPRKRERGSSAWRGNCDATFYLEAGEYDAMRGEAALTLRALKVRDAERPAPLHLIRRRVNLLLANRYGEPVTSCVIERDRRTREDRGDGAGARRGERAAGDRPGGVAGNRDPTRGGHVTGPHPAAGGPATQSGLCGARPVARPRLAGATGPPAAPLHRHRGRPGCALRGGHDMTRPEPSRVVPSESSPSE